MKIQCACGAKYAFDVTPEQAQQPVRFVCPSCGLDSSEYVTNLVRQQFGIVSIAAAPATEIAPPPPGVVMTPASAAPAPVSMAAPVPMAAPLRVAAPPPPPPAAAPRIRLNTGGAKAAEEPAEESGVRMCAKHSKIEATDECMVC